MDSLRMSSLTRIKGCGSAEGGLRADSLLPPLAADIVVAAAAAAVADEEDLLECPVDKMLMSG